jgi:excisionase family DNA binding protein
MMESIAEKNKLAYSVDEIAKLTSLSKPFLRNEIRAGRLKVNRFGSRVLVLAETLHEYLAKGQTIGQK